MARLQRLPHGVHIADALESVVAATVRHLHQRLGSRLGQRLGVQELRHTKRFSCRTKIKSSEIRTES